MSKQTIKGIDCYGEWRWNSNAVVVGTYETGDELEEIYVDGGNSWEEVVDVILGWATDQGAIVEELQAC